MARPSLRFLGSLPNLGYKQSIFFHYVKSNTCGNNPSYFLPFACHVRFSASLVLANKHLNHEWTERYHNTFIGRSFFMLFPSSYHISLGIMIPCILDTYTMLQTLFHTIFNHWDMHVFFGTPYSSDVISYSPHSGRSTSTFRKHFMQQLDQFNEAFTSPPISFLNIN